MKIEVPHREHSPETDNLAYSIFSVPLARVPPRASFHVCPDHGKARSNRSRTLRTVQRGCMNFSQGPIVITAFFFLEKHRVGLPSSPPVYLFSAFGGNHV